MENLQLKREFLETGQPTTSKNQENSRLSLNGPSLLVVSWSSAFFGLLFLLMFTIGGSTGIILGNAAVDLGLHDTD